MDKTKVKYGVVRIAQSSVIFIAQTFGALFGIVLAFAGIAFIVERAANRFDGTIRFLAAGIIAVVNSISFTQWLLLVLVLIVWNNNLVGRRILNKLKEIESAVATKIRED